MDIELFIPKSKKLQKYIEFFYILNHSGEEKQNTSYFAFPNINKIVTIILNAETIVKSDHEVIIQHSKNSVIESSLVANLDGPICFQYKGNIKEITICFKPLGLNAFIQNDLDVYGKDVFNKRFIPFPDYKKSMIKILSNKDNKVMATDLEMYWLSKVKSFDHPFLNEVIASLINNPEQSISSLSEKHKISNKTLIKHFKKHLCISPSNFRKIVRFRKTLNEKLDTKERLNLTRLSYGANYFDQAHMIHDFKSLTGLSPKRFFSNLTTLEENQINWMFI